jgi:hypothetical protein
MAAKSSDTQGAERIASARIVTFAGGRDHRSLDYTGVKARSVVVDECWFRVDPALRALGTATEM